MAKSTIDMDRTAIERLAHGLHVDLWRGRQALLGRADVRPRELLEPYVVAHMLGVEFEEVDDLGRFGYGRDRFAVAGMIDRQRNKIAVSHAFRGPSVRFTGAHEVGHWLMHKEQVMHRDRPIEGLHLNRPPRNKHEQEADYFSACFLVPERLAVEALERTFETKGKFVLDDRAAFFLRPDDPYYFYEADSWELAMALATARSYGGRHVLSLTEQFGVSPGTMAIRLRELQLIAA